MEVKINDETGRIDIVLSEVLNKSRTKIQKLIKNELILVNDKVVNSNYQVSSGDVIVIKDDDKNEANPLKPLDLDIDVVYEDDDLLIINKPSGLVTHPAPGHYEDTLVNALLSKYDLAADPLRPGIVHRLDKDTSGLMLVAKTEEAREKLSDMLKNKEVIRIYLALVEGVIKNDTGEIDAPIGRDPKDRKKMKVIQGGKKAITHFKVLERYKDKTLVACKLDTGRTHQIRVHFAYISHPVVNDPLYGKSKKTTEFNQMLHSYKIKLTQPITKKNLEFTTEAPEEFKEVLNSCEKE